MAESFSRYGMVSNNGVDLEDPFVSQTPAGDHLHRESHRYSSFDAQLFSLTSSSPLQVKRALEAHLAETDRRLQETSKLGTALIEQQRELTDQLRQVEEQQDDGEIPPDLRQKLNDLEREYNDIGRETARTSLNPKIKIMDEGLGTSSLESRHPGSPAVFSSQATNSPSKVSVPSRKQRNQPSSRVHDIEFATEISTSLLAQVRQLQTLLAEREETVKALNLEKSRLEFEAEGFTQRLRALDESEQRYKDENWSLETQTHELLAAAKEASDKERRLTSSLNILAADKNKIQRELDELKQANGKFAEEHIVAQKAYDSELHILRRNVNLGETERNALQQKVEELAAQNQELAKAVATKLRHHETDSSRSPGVEKQAIKAEDSTPENSPPPSPSKPTPRHGHLESETLKSSLHHAHRMIQTLKGTIHREKTEKIELKRMLQEARDEIEQRRAEPTRPVSSHNKRQKQKGDAFKKPPRPEMLGAGRKGFTHIEIAEPDWEDDAGEPSPTRSNAPNRRTVSYSQSGMESSAPSDAYQTANETEAFETANERETTTESEAFQTGAENFAGDSSDDLTETESRALRTGTIRGKTSGQLSSARPLSFASTASTSGDEDDYTPIRSPTHAQPQRYRLKMGRGRRSRMSQDSMHSGTTPLSPRDSPASLRSPPQSPQQRTVSGSQSLFAELGGLGGVGSDNEFGAPLRSSAMSDFSNPSRRESFATFPDSSRPVTAAEVVMADSCTMTEPITPRQFHDAETSTLKAQVADASTNFERPILVDSATQFVPLEQPALTQTESILTANFAPQAPEPVKLVDSTTQYAPLEIPSLARSEPIVITDIAPDIPKENNIKRSSNFVAVAPLPVDLHTEKSVSLNRSSIYFEQTPPISSTPKEYEPRQMDMSAINFESTAPSPPVAKPLELALSQVQSTATSPVETTPPALAISSVLSTETQPEPPNVLPKALAALQLSEGRYVETLPLTAATAPVISKDPNAILLASRGLGSSTSQRTDRGTQFESSTADTGSNTLQFSESQKAIRTDVPSRLETSPPRTPIGTAEISAQTILTGVQIDKLLLERQASRPVTAIETKQADPAANLQTSPLATPKAKSQSSSQSTNQGGMFLKPVPTGRPSSSGSQRSNSLHPPLPVDHKQAIAAAAQKLSSDPAPGTMGPPVAPASSYRSTGNGRPQTPNDQQPSRASIRNMSTPQTKFRRASASMNSRRSSISSFASEIDERFNLARGAYPFESGADPRMIQAITQTMIGEFLWKYTRKAGRSDMSTTRHRRYFWVHPYTRTLYWSTQDPQSLGKAQDKSKSVAIEAVRIVNDDNPYPPGLHRKSLEIITPGRTIKFTAATSQRHETWFNALSYLLLRTTDGNPGEHQTIWETGSDINSINGRTSRQAESHRSLSSYNSRPVRAISKQFVEAAPTLRRPVTPNQPSPSLSSRPGSSLRPEASRPGSVSRISSALRPSGIMSTFSSRKSRYGNANGSIDSTSAASNDSAEDLRRVIERQDREADRLENVRACCDGKHDVSSLSRTSRYSSRVSPLSHVHS